MLDPFYCHAADPPSLAVFLFTLAFHMHKCILWSAQNAIYHVDVHLFIYVPSLSCLVSTPCLPVHSFRYTHTYWKYSVSAMISVRSLRDALDAPIRCSLQAEQPASRSTSGSVVWVECFRTDLCCYENIIFCIFLFFLLRIKHRYFNLPSESWQLPAPSRSASSCTVRPRLLARV